MLGNCVLALLLAAPAPAPAPAAPELRVREEFLAAKMAQAEGRLKESAGHFQSALAMRPEDPILEFEYAVLLQQLDLDDDARVHAMRSAGFDPNFDSAWALAGTLDLASAEKAADKDGEHADDRGGEKGRTAIARAVDELQRAHHLAPQNPSTLAALGRAELLNDRPDRARALLDEIPGLADNPGVLKIRAQADDRRGADAEAAKDYDQWVRADAGDREAVASAIEFFESRRDFKRALSLLRGLRVVDPDNVMIADRIALDRLRAGDFDGAERDARALAAARPEDRAARRTLAAALYQKGREEESVKMLRQLVEEDTDDPAAALTLALQLTSDGKDAEAVDVLQRLAKKAGENPGKTELRREIDAQIASIRYRARDLDSAKKIASASAISKDGVSDRLLGLLLQIARDEKKPQDGLEWARKAVAADPKNADDAASLAEFQIRADEAPAGRAALEKLAGSGIASDVLAAADAEQRLKNYAESARMASDALPRFAGNLDLLFRRGSALERGGRFEDAARAFEEILKVRPDDAQTLNYLGYMYAENGTHLAEARKMIEHAVELDPQNGAFLDSLGWVRFRMNDLEGAKSALRKAAQRMPSDPTVQEHLGDIQAKLGRKSEAVALWRKSLSLSPDEPEKIEKKIHEVGSSP